MKLSAERLRKIIREEFERVSETGLRGYDRWKTTRPDEDDFESTAEWIVGLLGKEAADEHAKKPFETEEQLADWLYSKTPGAYDIEVENFDEAAQEIMATLPI